jgi:ABC-type nitrate/sulfonate/bicarbonate transport system substrate-binding protein
MRGTLRRNALFGWSLVACLALLLAACAPAAQPSPTAAPAKPAESKPAAAAAPAKPTEAPAAKPAEAKPAASPAAAAKPAGPAVELRIGHGFAAEEQLWLMKARPDITPNQGKAYTLSFTAFRGNADRINAYEANQLDGGTIAAPTALFAAEQGLPLKLIASIARESTDPKWFRTTYLALEDSGIKTPADLRGKTIGIVDFRSATELWARAAVKTAGLNHNTDVKFVVFPFPGMEDALRTRKIDVGTFVQPFYAQTIARGGTVEVFNTKTGLPFEEDLLQVFVRPELLQRNQAAIRAFLSDYVAATRYYLENGRQARQALIDAKFVQTPPNLYLDIKDWAREPSGRITLDGLSQLQDLHLELGWQTKKVDLNQLVDVSLLP